MDTPTPQDPNPEPFRGTLNQQLVQQNAQLALEKEELKGRIRQQDAIIACMMLVFVLISLHQLPRIWEQFQGTTPAEPTPDISALLPSSEPEQQMIKELQEAELFVAVPLDRGWWLLRRLRKMPWTQTRIRWEAVVSACNRCGRCMCRAAHSETSYALRARISRSPPPLAPSPN